MEQVKTYIKIKTEDLQKKLKDGRTVHQEIMNTYGNAIIDTVKEDDFTVFIYNLVQVKEPEKLILDWPTYLNLIDKLIEKIPKNKYTSIKGVIRGGFIPAVIISHRLGIPYLSMLPSAGDFNNSKLLIVDDLIDTGATLKDYSCDIAVIHKKPWAKKEPTYFVEETDKWVVYPYEVEGEDT